MNHYKAFGFRISSEFPISQLTADCTAEAADITIRRADLSYFQLAHERMRFLEDGIALCYSDAGTFCVRNGNLILVDPKQSCTESVLGIFLMGSCMGAILHQRGCIPLHGSCVTDGKRSILLTGDSGAGKSTLAAEFLRRGWKLITDDVSALYDIEGVPMVQSSYPSQKLWQDALDRYEKGGEDIHSLYFSEDREKFGVNVTDSFLDGVRPLSMVVRLVPADHPTGLSPIEGMAKVDQLMRNTYRLYLIEKRHLQRHFQRCVTLSTKLPMALAVRENGKQCADTLYELITKHLEEHCHD